MRKSRTPQRPLFTVSRPLRASWTWHVTYTVASSGYVTECHVTAHSWHGDEKICGSAYCDVDLGHDLVEVIEFLATESMLAAVQPELTGATPPRKLTFVSGGL